MPSKFEDMLFSTDKPARIYLKRPDKTFIEDDQKKAAYIEGYSLESPFARAARDKVLKEVKNEDDAQIVALLSAITTGWYLVSFAGKPILDDSGAPLGFSPENAAELYSTPRALPWRVQVFDALSNLQNFMPASSAT